MAGPILAAIWCSVWCPEAFAKEDAGAGEPQGLGVAWMWKCSSWRNRDPEAEGQGLKSHPV